MIDLLLPRTDAGVGAQLAIVTIAAAGIVAMLGARSHWRVLVVGVWVMLVAVFGVRALH